MSSRQSKRTIPVVAILVMGSVIVGTIVVVAVLLILAGRVTIQPDEVGVVLRYGAVDRTLEPGVHSRLPAPIEEVVKIPVQRLLKEEFGRRSTEAGEALPDRTPDLELESRMVTADLNIVEVEWATQFHVGDPVEYATRVRDIDEIFRGVNQAAMRAVVGDRSIDEVLTIGRLEIEDEVAVRLQEHCDRLKSGIVIDQVVLLDVNLPAAVKAAFDEVVKAEHERERIIRKARAAAGSVARETGGGR